MKRLNTTLFLLLGLVMVCALFISEQSGARFTSASLNVENVFTFAQSGPGLQDKINQIVADISAQNILDGAHQNYNNKNSWSFKILNFVSGGSEVTNIYDFQNEVSADMPPFYGKNVVRMTDSSLSSSNPAVIITNEKDFDYSRIQQIGIYDQLRGTMIFFRRNGNQPLYYFVIEKDGTLGGLNTLDTP